MHILHNMSKSKGNWTMKFGQSIEQKIRKTFFKEKLETSSRPFPGKPKLSIFLDQPANVLYNMLLFMFKSKAMEMYSN